MLWREFWDARDAGDEERIRVNRTAIVERHLRFIYQLANRTRPRNWNRETVDEYVAELVVVALELVDRYDPSKGADFLTYLRRSHYAARNRVFASRAPFSGMDTNSLSARRRVEHELVVHGPMTSEQMRAALGLPAERRRGRIGLDSLLAAPDLVDAEVVEHASSRDVGAHAERVDLRERVRRVVDGLELDARDRIIVERRLLAQDPARQEDLAAAFGVTRQAVSLRERALIKRLAAALEAAGLAD